VAGILDIHEAGRFATLKGVLVTPEDNREGVLKPATSQGHWVVGRLWVNDLKSVAPSGNGVQAVLDSMVDGVWPECFRTGIVAEEDSRGTMCGNGLLARGHVAMGMLPTHHFDQVMKVLAMRLGIGCDPDSFVAESDRLCKLSG
jgi:hypothetical protein